MYTLRQSLALYADAGRPLPHVPELQPLYDHGIEPRHGQVVMIAGRSGTQKSGFAMFWTAKMGLPTLYFAADMSPFDTSVRLACMATKKPTEVVLAELDEGGTNRKRILRKVDDIPIRFAFGSPIRFQKIDQELEAYVETYNAYPEVMVFDNLMDFDGAESDYSVQMEVMSEVTALTRDTGITSIILHHATDKSWDAKENPWDPPSRDQIKGGLSEKPELSLSVALDPSDMEYKVACIKQRNGPSNPTGKSYAKLLCIPEQTRFRPYNFGEK